MESSDVARHYGGGDLLAAYLGALREAGEAQHLRIPNIPAKGANLKRNVDEGRIVLIRCVAHAPA